ncbi:MAG: GGDEF domain-containing protein, partial [Oscillospiraceae bacterium]
DFFKKVNDTHGHAVGDEILVQLYQILRVNVRDEDFVVRYGGEEFLVLCAGLDYEAAFVVAERIRKCVAEHDFPTSAGSLRLTVSIGVFSGRPGAQDTLEAYIETADQSMYQAKNNGRNRVM